MRYWCIRGHIAKAPDQKTSKTYVLNVLRLPMDDATLKNMRIEKGTSAKQSLFLELEDTACIVL